MGGTLSKEILDSLNGNRTHTWKDWQEQELNELTFRSNSADLLAVTEVTEDTYVFRWNIHGFKVCLKDRDPRRELRSPVFQINKGESTTQWRLRIKWNKKIERCFSNEQDEFVSIFLQLIEGKNPTKAYFEIDLFNSVECGRKVSSQEIKTFTLTTPLYGFTTFIHIEDLLNPLYEFLEEGTLKLQCLIKVEDDAEHLVSFSKTAAGETSCKRNLKSDLSDLYNSSTFSDVSIQTKTSVLKAHKNILSCRSPVFSCMFHTEMMESINNTVNISDFDENIVEGMLKYVYGCELSQEFLEGKAMDLFQIADKYNIEGLKEDSEKAISRKLSIENVSECLIFADANNAINLKKNSIKFFNMNTSKVKNTEGFQKLLAYNSSPSIFMDLYKALL